MTDDILSQIRRFAPTTGRHPDQTSWKGYWTETKVMASAALKARNQDVTKFLIIARARSGTTLLTDLLNAHPNVTCDREVLVKKVRAPVSYLENLARKSTTAAYGAKLLSYQMVLVQDFTDPIGFLKTLERQGFKFIHLQRDTFAQTVSLTRAQASDLYHSKSAASSIGTVDPQEFLRRLAWNAKLAEYETHCLASVPHLKLSYDTDLAHSEGQSDAANKVFDFIGVPQVDVASEFKKILPRDPRKALENYDEIKAAVVEAGFGYVLPADEPERV